MAQINGCPLRLHVLMLLTLVTLLQKVPTSQFQRPRTFFPVPLPCSHGNCMLMMGPWWVARIFLRR